MIDSYSVVPLNGPWKFHTGDDPRWAAPTFDDSAWENVDLAPPPLGSHDADVGLTGYVPGRTTKGHPGYSGYAWYRISVAITAPRGATLALSGPPDVDDAYQLFFNGHLLGSAGNFSGATPAVYSIQPRIFRLPQSPASASADKPVVSVLAFRVWMDRSSLSSPDAGGIHIAPALGPTRGIESRYDLQWMQTFWGYVVDAILPVLFVLLAIMACALIPFDPSDAAYRWLAVALLLIALIRLNQALFFWFQFESVPAFDFARNVFLDPLNFAAWTMAWRAWFQLRTPKWTPKAVAAFTVLYMAAQFLTRPSLHLALSHPVSAAFHSISSGVRLLFALLLLFIVHQGIRRCGRDARLALPAVLLISIGLFAKDLSALRIPGIWFPYGVGVSRTQFAYAAFVVALFALLLRRLFCFASRSRRLVPEPRPAETL